MPFEDMEKVVEEASVIAIASVFINAFSDCTKPTTTCATAETLINDDSSSATCCVNAQNIVETVSKDALAKASAPPLRRSCNSPCSTQLVCPCVALGCPPPDLSLSLCSPALRSLILPVSSLVAGSVSTLVHVGPNCTADIRALLQSPRRASRHALTTPRT